MLNLSFIRQNPDAVRRAIQEKNVDLDLDHLLSLDETARELRTRVEGLRRDKNQISKEFASATPEQRADLGRKAKEISAAIKADEKDLEAAEAELRGLMLRVPNIPSPEAPVGPDESANVVVRREGTPRAFDFTPRDHVELLEMNDWADLGRVTGVSGSRTYCLKGRLALLEQVLLTHVAKKMMEAGFTFITVPSLAREAAFTATGHFPTGREDAYYVPEDDIFLAGTAEIVLTSLHSGEILEDKALPILYAGFSPCFRREAGSAGRDVRGLLRVHQFYKVEQYVICRNDPEESARWHATLLSIAESVLKDLELPYQVIETSTGDMGAGKYRMNDIETWVPSLEKYRETHSCSTLHEWQARRANLRYRDAEGTVTFAHTLNNTAVATPRVLVPLLENHQTEDGRVRLPEVLRPYFGGDEFL